jgi:hypothetical protein
LGTFVRQYYRYARGDGKANLWPRRHALRYLTYFLAVPALLVLGVRNPVYWLLGVTAAAASMFLAPYRRLVFMWSGLSAAERIRAAAWVPVIRVVGDLAKMAGYPVGWVWRLRHRRPRWRSVSNQMIMLPKRRGSIK